MQPGSFIQMIILDEFIGCLKITIEDLADQIQHFMIRLASSQLSMTLRLWITFNSRWDQARLYRNKVSESFELGSIKSITTDDFGNLRTSWTNQIMQPYHWTKKNPNNWLCADNKTGSFYCNRYKTRGLLLNSKQSLEAGSPVPVAWGWCPAVRRLHCLILCGTHC